MKISALLRRLTGRVAPQEAEPEFGILEGKGERVDINLNERVDFETLNMYQKSHWKRYEFALSKLPEKGVFGDFACGTGYGSVILSEKAEKVIGADLNAEVIEAVRERYQHNTRVEYHTLNLLEMDYENHFDAIVSFETIEHLEENDIARVLRSYHKALKPGGTLLFSTPYMQEKSEKAVKMGFHLTFWINEEKIRQWLSTAGFESNGFYYQNYESHEVVAALAKKDFILCHALKATAH